MATKKPRNKKYWYKQSKKWKAQKRHNLLLDLPIEVRIMVYGNVFARKRMIDTTITHKGDYRRKYGAQSLLFVNKTVRKEAFDTFYKTCVFEVPHFRLHSKHRQLNRMKSLDSIRNLHILWTMPIYARFTSNKADDSILIALESLRELTLDLKGFQYMLIDSGINEADMHSNLITKCEPHFRNLPKWMKRLIKNASEHLTIYLIVYFFAAPVAAPTFFAVSSRSKSCS